MSPALRSTLRQFAVGVPLVLLVLAAAAATMWWLLTEGLAALLDLVVAHLGAAPVLLAAVGVGWLVLRRLSPGRAATGNGRVATGHAHGVDDRPRLVRHEAGHVVAARKVGGTVTSARVGPGSGWGFDGFVKWNLPDGSDIEQREANVAFLLAGGIAAGTDKGCGFDNASVDHVLRGLPSGEKARIRRVGKATAKRIVARHQGEIARVAARLDAKGRL